MSKENAVKVLKEVQNARDTLERNIFEVCRKHEQMDLFSYFDERGRYGNEENVDVLRIKRQVNEKIKEISNEIKDEVYTKKTSTDKVGAEKKINKRYGRYSQYNKNSTVTAPQIPTNTKPKNKPIKPKGKTQKGKPKETKKTEPPPKSSSAYDELVLQHLYGRQPHQAHRHTFKKEQPGFCSPHKFNVSRNLQDARPSNTVTETKPVSNDYHIQPKSEYCIHLQPHETPYTIANNFPTAKSLVEPSRDPSGRLPLPIVVKDVTVMGSPPKARKKKQLSKAGPNVAVINIKSDDVNEREASKSRIRMKIRERCRNRKLNIQPLPNVDIDTTDPSSTLSSESSRSVNDTKHTIDKSVNQPSFNELAPENQSQSEENPYDFQDFISVQDIAKKNTSDTEIDFEVDESFKQPQISLPGSKIPPEQEYHGPSFPPRQFKQVDDSIDTVPVKMTPTLEKSAQNWLEKELLARLITQMVDQQNLLPTTDEYADNVSTMSVQDEESISSHDWIQNLIGLQGIQLFVDAGIPVNEDIIKELVRCVILEYLETLFGHPQPERVVVPPVDKDEETKVITPVCTPLPTPCASEKEDIPLTPDQTISDLTEQNINDIIDETDLVEEDCEGLQYQEVKTPEMSIVESEDYHALKSIVTPNTTMIEDADPSACNDIQTPVHSEKSVEFTQIPITDFEHTEKIMSPISTLADEKNTVSEFCVTPAPVVLSVKSSPATTSPSVPSSTFTMSSSATVGLSTFEEISSGEYLNADSVISDASEGELKLGGRFKSLNLADDSVVSDSISSKPGTKRHLFPPIPPRTIEKHSRRGSPFLSEGEINQTFRPLKSIGEVSDINKSDQTDIDTEDLDDDNDPMTKLLHKIKSPQHYQGYPEHAEKSEGEILSQSIKYNTDRGQLSFGENIPNVSQNIGMFNTGNEESDLISSIKDDSDLNTRLPGQHLNRPDRDLNPGPNQDLNPGHDQEKPGPVVRRRVINVQPVSHDEIIEGNFVRLLPTDDEMVEHEISSNVNDNKLNDDMHIFSNNNENIAHNDASKSEGEFLHEDKMADVNFDLSSVESLGDEEDKEKLVMVLRLPEVEDEQNATDDDDDDDLSTGAISSISEF